MTIIYPNQLFPELYKRRNTNILTYYEINELVVFLKSVKTVFLDITKDSINCFGSEISAEVTETEFKISKDLHNLYLNSNENFLSSINEKHKEEIYLLLDEHWGKIIHSKLF